ncbi:MAG: tyrosine--tRNA ligase [Flavobacteriaceae bacterium]
MKEMLNKNNEIEDYSIYYLGPEGSFSEAAAKRAREWLLSNPGGWDCESTDLCKFRLYPAKDQRVMEGGLAYDKNAFVVVPISNSRKGDVYDFLPFCSYEMITEIHVPVSFCLCSKSTLNEVKGLITKSIAYGQVREDLIEQIGRGYDTSQIDDNTSTSRAAELAAADESLAAICSIESANKFGLNIHIKKIESTPIETTFGVFRNEDVGFAPDSDLAPVYYHLMRGSKVYSGRHMSAGRRGFANLLKSGKKLKIKWGVDPLYESLHLGHLANLLKLRDFLDHGHELVVVIGNFTGVIGDPSGNLTRRSPINDRNLNVNGQKLCAQIKHVLNSYDFQLVWNEDLFRDFDLRKFVKWMYDTEVTQVHQRPDFQNRIKGKYGLSVAEFVYPLFQAFDTAQIQPDIEVGGVDQLWNCLLAKDLMRREGLKVPIVLLTDELQGTDGSAKMSSFEHNSIRLDESESGFEAKIMNLPSELLCRYFRALTRVESEEIGTLEMGLGNEHLVSTWRKRLVTELSDYMYRPN